MRSEEVAINEDAFEALLRWFHPEREQAGEIYEQMRARLIRFFDIQGCPFSEECADDTLQRAARKIIAGITVQAADPYTYLRGIARNVMLEAWKRKERAPAALEDLPPAQEPAIAAEAPDAIEQAAEQERMLACLQHCLESLPAESRELFTAYYQEENRVRIDGRATLAAQLGIDITALRNRVTRVRARLEKCVRDCMERVGRGGRSQ